MKTTKLPMEFIKNDITISATKLKENIPPTSKLVLKYFFHVKFFLYFSDVLIKKLNPKTKNQIDSDT
jgi:hypothetical protein